MSKFTPGPWAVHPHSAYVVPAAHMSRPIGGSSDADQDLAKYAQEICALHWPDRHRPQAEVRANAHLIAAAPAMYEYISSSASGGCIEAKKLLEAIYAGGDGDPDVVFARAAIAKASPQ